MRRYIDTFVIHMHKRPLHTRHRFEHILQRLGQIVAVLQRRVAGQHNVDFHVELVARVVGL